MAGSSAPLKRVRIPVLVPLVCASVGVAVAGFEIGARTVGLDHNLSPNPAYPEQRLTTLFARLGVTSVTLRDECQPYLDEVLPHIGGHLSVAGHRRTAEALYRKLVASGIAGVEASRGNGRRPGPLHAVG